MKVVDPAGQIWHVHRRWLPWNPRAARMSKDVQGDLSGFDFGGVDDIAGPSSSS